MIDTNALDQAVRRFPLMLASAKIYLPFQPNWQPLSWIDGIRFEYRHILRERTATCVYTHCRKLDLGTCHPACGTSAAHHFRTLLSDKFFKS